MIKKCEFYVESKSGIFEDYRVCGKKAKYITNDGKMVCGIHRNIADKVARVLEKPLCTEIAFRTASMKKRRKR